MPTRQIHRLAIAGMALMILSAAVVSQTRADVTVPSVIGSHMVLQRDQPLPIWGWADPGERVTVELDGKTVSTKTDAKGNWKVVLPAMKADAKPHRMTIVGNNKIVLDDILVGDVWLGSGQSNMQMPMTETGNREAISAVNHPNIRLLQVAMTKAPKPAKNVEAAWTTCTPTSVEQFSAALYHFGQRLNNELHVSIGLINSSWGGSRIEWWIPTEANKQSGEMYNGMIAPLQPFAIRGFVWYQGEANVYSNKGMGYSKQMETLIGCWREAWGADKPFYYVQLAPWNYSGYPPGRLPVLWENQIACLKIPGTGMVVTVDLSDQDGLKTGHPLNKHDVGKRLAILALNKTYGQKDLVCYGPLYKSMAIEGDKIRLHFYHVHGGLKSRDGRPLCEFQIAGDDNRFVNAKAKIDGRTVVVSAKGINAPTQVRFAWHKLANPNLANTAGLPASPFRTLPANTHKTF